MTITSETTVLTTTGLIEFLALDVYLAGRQTEGLTHEDSLLQPAPRGNCLNWVLGHVLVYRKYMLDQLGVQAAFAVPDPSRYDTNSEPITANGPGVMPLPDLLASLQASQEQLASELTAASPEMLSAPSPTKSDKSVVSEIHFLMWHEISHIGQIEQLRQLAGTDDKVI